MNARFVKRFLILIFLLSLACSAPSRLFERPGANIHAQGTIDPAKTELAQATYTPQPAASPTLTRLPIPTRAATATQALTRTAMAPAIAATTAATALARSDEACLFHPQTARLLEQTSAEQWISWVAKLSGAEPVSIAGETTRIDTRYSPAMFDGQPNARAFEWLLQEVLQWYPISQIEIQPFEVTFQDAQHTWKNLIITLPGQTRPDETVVLSAHLDSTSDQPLIRAPGAEDNASGSATLIEAARLFRDARFERTVQIVWFTGEEQGLLGSQAYVKAAQARGQKIIGAINLDMFGYDSDNDRCFELHVGTLPQSKTIGECFTTAIEEYELDLTYDVLTTQAIDLSDHGSFWEADLGAIEVLENLFENNQPNGCPNRDSSPHYHTLQDVVENLNAETGFTIALASLAALAGMAQPLSP